MLKLSCGQNLGTGQETWISEETRLFHSFVPSFSTYLLWTYSVHTLLGGRDAGGKQTGVVLVLMRESREEWVLNEITTETHVKLLQSRWYREVIFCQKRDFTEPVGQGKRPGRREAWAGILQMHLPGQEGRSGVGPLNSHFQFPGC